MILLLQYTLIFTSVLMLVALGGCFSEHSGVINIGLEGIMVIGALGGALVMKFMPGNTPAFAMILCVTLGAMLLGMIYSLLLAVAAINFKADQTLVGTAMNLLATAGATVFVKAMNTAASVDNVSSEISYVNPKKALLVNIGGFEFNWSCSSPWCCCWSPMWCCIRRASAFASVPAASILRRRPAWASTSSRCAMPAC